ncbi:DUF5316 domain-containing protein [Lysinibacillus sp. FSL H8-0500]|uniref:DUF5316 domain-containing protein n=1 Tax=Lysinibacillus sp. FSL H8-0500 TaxID=2921393 RepID=UPI0031010374
MRYVVIGTIVSMLGVVVSMLLWGVQQAYFLPGIVGFICLAVSMLLSGALVSGDRMRANFATETTAGRHERHRVMTRALLLAVPNLIIAIIAYTLYS